MGIRIHKKGIHVERGLEIVFFYHVISCLGETNQCMYGRASVIWVVIFKEVASQVKKMIERPGVAAT